jgi:hypothetical protein
VKQHDPVYPVSAVAMMVPCEIVRNEQVRVIQKRTHQLDGKDLEARCGIESRDEEEPSLIVLSLCIASLQVEFADVHNCQ